jgi:hypothetical protein
MGRRPVSEVIDLQSQLASLAENQEFVADCCRFSEEILTENQVRKKYRLSESSWSILGENDSLVEKIEAEKIRRIRDGSVKRERAQQLVVEAPGVLGDILMDGSQNARHRIDSAKALNDLASNGPGQSAPAGDRFLIQINLGADTLTFNKSIAINPNDIDPNDTGTTPQGPFPAAIANKPWDGDGG